jgi:hypothetical protein
MDWSERLMWLLLGCMIGFILGYIVRTLREIKDEVHEVDEIVKHDREIGNSERGALHGPTAAGVALIIVVGLSVWASFASARTNNDVQHTQAQLKQVTDCNKDYLSRTIGVINARTRYAQRQAIANVELQKSQARFINLLLHDPPPDQATSLAAFHEYLNDLNTFISTSSDQANTVEQNPYPTTAELDACVNKPVD